MMPSTGHAPDGDGTGARSNGSRSLSKTAKPAAANAEERTAEHSAQLEHSVSHSFKPRNHRANIAHQDLVVSG